MRSRRALCLLLAIGWLCSAGAHTRLEEAIPADGSVLHATPTTLVLRFSEPARLTVLWIARRGGTKQKLTALPVEPQARISVNLPRLEPGDYEISFRVMGADGHVVPGQLHFSLTE